MHKGNPIWWKQQSALERGLMVVAMSSVFFCIALAVDKADAQPPPEDVQTVSEQSGNEDVCSSPECIRTASDVLKNMDPDVEPCDDFYRFTCGGFLKSTSVPDDEDRVDVISGRYDKARNQLRAMMEEPSDPSELKPFRLVKNLYKSCMNEPVIEDQGLKPLHKILEELGSNVDYLFAIDIEVYSNRGEKYGDAELLKILYEDLLRGVDDEYVNAYYSYIVETAVRLGTETAPPNSTELEESPLFQINLLNITPTWANHSKATRLYNIMTLDELTNNYPNIPWREYFSELLTNDIRVEENEVVHVLVPRFFYDLEKLLSKTPKEIQANYVIWKAVKDSVGVRNDDIHKSEPSYVRGFRPEVKFRWHECVNDISGSLYVAVAAMYVRKYFNVEVKQNVVDIAVDIREQFYKIIQQVDWMDAKRRQSTLKKATAISILVAYSDGLLNDTRLEKYYENLELSGENYFDNLLNITLFRVDNNKDAISEINPFDPTIHYQWYINTLFFPAAALQGAFFGSDRPKYMNYGSIGLAIGHAIAHVFDDIEKQFNKDSNPVDSSKENYLKRVECIIHQYGNYTVEEVGLKLNGTETQKFNIANNAGIKVAYLAYKDWVERNKPEQKLPGLPYSPNQMFWIATANLWCAKWEPEGLKRYITNGKTPHEFRVIGSVSNMPEFSEDFNCPIGSKMNPEKKCSVW